MPFSLLPFSARRSHGPAGLAGVGIAAFGGDLRERLTLLFQFEGFGLPVVGRFDLRHLAARRRHGSYDRAYLVEFLTA